ncbi:tenascin XB [Chlorella sorokiniana]|uniref:Tenascin XB n=1 Tax=Chlorella sorokiniana TaxID=3076 RepID=A0A2P6TNK5_CHLSO|nr:tenascin XB [Chlorella sorokiniana]|eukprot:PRW50912.1 tenascin XB [Chlorella sorokiniana]
MRRKALVLVAAVAFLLAASGGLARMHGQAADAPATTGRRSLADWLLGRKPLHNSGGGGCSCDPCSSQDCPNYCTDCTTKDTCYCDPCSSQDCPNYCTDCTTKDTCYCDPCSSQDCPNYCTDCTTKDTCYCDPCSSQDCPNYCTDCATKDTCYCDPCSSQDCPTYCDVCSEDPCCGISCTSPEECCGGECVDKSSDNANCGKCGEICDTANHFTCQNGSCACEQGYTPVGDLCCQEVPNCSAYDANCHCTGCSTWVEVCAA